MQAIQKCFNDIWSPHRELTDRRPDASALTAARSTLAPALPPGSPLQSHAGRPLGVASEEISREADRLQKQVRRPPRRTLRMHDMAGSSGVVGSPPLADVEALCYTPLSLASDPTIHPPIEY